MIEIRPARPDEASELAEIGMTAWLRGIGPHVSDDIVTRLVRNNPFIPFLRELGSKILVAQYQGQPAGIGASEHSDNHISDIWVAPQFEGHGVGSALVRALEREIAGRGHTEAYIQVTAANERAYGLYRHLGYIENWRETQFDPILETDLDKIGLKKTF